MSVSGADERTWCQVYKEWEHAFHSSMWMTRSPSVLEELPDLALLELFSYLSSFDAGWLFARMNQRFHALVQERSFRCINWSPARSNQFDLLLNLLPLENVHSLAIDQEASQLQLLRWPRLPRLKALRIKGVWNSEHLQIFLLCHAPTLTDLIVEAYEEDLMVSDIDLLKMGTNSLKRSFHSDLEWLLSKHFVSQTELVFIDRFHLPLSGEPSIAQS